MSDTTLPRLRAWASAPTTQQDVLAGKQRRVSFEDRMRHRFKNAVIASFATIMVFMAGVNHGHHDIVAKVIQTEPAAIQSPATPATEPSPK